MVTTLISIGSHNSTFHHGVYHLWLERNTRVFGGKQALEFKQLNIHAWEAFDKGHDVHMQAAPSQAELLYKNFKVNKEKLKSEVKETVMEKYGNAATEEQLPRELLLGQSEREVEYDRAGRIIKGQVYLNYFLCLFYLSELNEGCHWSVDMI